MEVPPRGVINSHSGTSMKQLSSIKHVIQRAPSQIGRKAVQVVSSTCNRAHTLIAQVRVGISTFGEYNPPAPNYVPKRVGFQRSVAVDRRPPQKDSSAPRAYRQRPSAQDKPQAATIPLKTDHQVSNEEINAMAAELEEALDAFELQNAPQTAMPSSRAEVDQAFDDMLKELDSEQKGAETKREQAIQEVDSLLDQLDREIAAKHPRSVTPARTAQAKLDASTAELAALMNQLKQGVVKSQTAYVASEGEMRIAVKVTESGRTIGSDAVTESLEEQRQPKMPVFLRPQQALMAEAVTLPIEPMIDSTR